MLTRRLQRSPRVRLFSILNRWSAGSLSRNVRPSRPFVIISSSESICPGCGLAMPRHPDLVYDRDFNASAECWEVFTEVIGKEFSNVLLFGQVHHLTVDAYAAHHTGGNHRDKSVL